jgi:peptidoglycan/xylan/chitin deacetylase (PgdA/CDA1 family)
MPVKPMAITIDDGYLDNYTIAYPVLEKWKVPATVFIATDFVEKREWL